MRNTDTNLFSASNLSAQGIGTGTHLDRKYIKDGLTFLEKQLEKVDEIIKEPLATTSWPRDMPVKTGGGFVEGVASYDVSYATAGAETDSLIEENSNDLPVMQADFGRDVARTFLFGQVLKIPYIQQQKLANIGLNLEETLNKGIHLHHDKTLDKNVYVGFAKYGTPGLVNNPAITRTALAKKFSAMTADEILAAINGIITQVWEANECVIDGVPNHLLMPPEQFSYIVNTKVGVTGDKSILTYILENNIATSQGVNLVIAPCVFCKGIGAGSTDRMVAYVNDIERIRFDQTVPLRRLQTEMVALAYQTPFVAQFSQVQFLYPTTVAYVDGI